MGPHCPDIGVAVNVDDDLADELWVGWSDGPPPTLDFNQLVLQPPTFAPSATHPAISPARASVLRSRMRPGDNRSAMARRFEAATILTITRRSW